MIARTRRELLTRLGRAALLSPMLWLPPERARGQGPSRVARRLVVFFSPNGTVHRRWRPEVTGERFRFPAGSILEPLAPIADQLTIVDGLDFVGTSNHEGGMSAMLTGGGGLSSPTRGASVDQWIAGRLPADSRFPSLELGVQTSAWGGNVQTRMSYRQAGEMVPPNDRPAEVHRRLFADAAGGPGAAEVLLRKRRSVLDLARAELDELRAALGAEERTKLDAHEESLRRVELGLTGGGTAPTACAPPAILSLSPGDNDNFPAIGRAQTDLLVAALACGATRVASLQWSHTVSPTVFSWLGIGDGHHALSHTDDANAAGLDAFVAAERWFAEQLVYLVSRLAELPEPGAPGSMLDHSLVVWAKEMGDSRLHECKAVPFVLAGSAGGFLRPGRYLTFPGTSHARLLVSICQAMGLDDRVFGDAAHGTGPLEGLAT